MSMTNSFPRAVLSFGLMLIAGTALPGLARSAPRLPAAPPDYRAKLVGGWATDGTAAGEFGPVTIEFRADGMFEMAIGPIELKGTYKVVKADGRVLTVEADMTDAKIGDLKVDPRDGDDRRKMFEVTFDGADTITMDPKDKPDPLKLKRKK